jgi:hypothetical protein
MNTAILSLRCGPYLKGDRVDYERTREQMVAAADTIDRLTRERNEAVKALRECAEAKMPGAARTIARTTLEKLGERP